MKYRCTKCGKMAEKGGYTVHGPNDDVICDDCFGAKRDSQGLLIDVMDDYRRGWAMELILYGVVGIILAVLLFAVLKEAGLMPFFWGLLDAYLQ